jgi:hypothetical protein
MRPLEMLFNVCGSQGPVICGSPPSVLSDNASHMRGFNWESLGLKLAPGKYVRSYLKNY